MRTDETTSIGTIEDNIFDPSSRIYLLAMVKFAVGLIVLGTAALAGSSVVLPSVAYGGPLSDAYLLPLVALVLYFLAGAVLLRSALVRVYSQPV